MTDGQWARGGPDEIEMFATGTTVAVEPEPPAFAELLQRSRSTVRDGYEHARDFHARSGHRPGTPITTVSPRRSGPADIVRPVLVNPLDACDAALSGRLFHEGVPGLDLDERGTDAHTERYLVWNAEIHVEHGRSVSASLHLLASPSMVVTIIELVPQRRLRRHRDAFVRSGLDVIETLAERLCQITARPADRSRV